MRCRSTTSIRRTLLTAIARLVSERLHERDVLVGERLRFATRENDDPDEVVLNHDRDADHRSVVLRRTTIAGVLRVVMDVRNVDRRTCQRRAAGGCRSVESVWVLSVPLSSVSVRVVRHHM